MPYERSMYFDPFCIVIVQKNRFGVAAHAIRSIWLYFRFAIRQAFCGITIVNY